jgi:single-strand DNA-binding protein
MNYQKLIIAGNATRDVELKKSQSGEVTYATLRVAVNDGKEEPVYFPITIFGKQAEIVAEYVTKGRAILVEGHIEATKNGGMNVVADRVVFGPHSQGKETGGYKKAKRVAEALAEAA